MSFFVTDGARLFASREVIEQIREGVDVRPATGRVFSGGLDHFGGIQVYEATEEQQQRILDGELWTEVLRPPEKSEL